MRKAQMAGKEELNSGEDVCWRKQVDDNLNRLQSLLFGAELALERNDFSSAQIFGLRLLGFLDSQSHSELDHAFISPIRREAVSKLGEARHSLIPDSDRYACLSFPLGASISLRTLALCVFNLSFPLV